MWFTALKNSWLAGVGKTAEQLQAQASPAVAYGVAFLCNVAVAYGLLMVLQWRHAATAGSGANVALLLGILIAAAVLVTELAFEARGLRFTMIVAGYPVVGMTIMGAILGAMQPAAR